MLSGRDEALPAGRPLVRASPCKLQPTAMVRVSTRLFSLQTGACDERGRLRLDAKLYTLECYLAIGGVRCSLLLSRLDTGRTACLEARLLLVNFPLLAFRQAACSVLRLSYVVR